MLTKSRKRTLEDACLLDDDDGDDDGEVDGDDDDGGSMSGKRPYHVMTSCTQLRLDAHGKITLEKQTKKQNQQQQININNSRAAKPMIYSPKSKWNLEI